MRSITVTMWITLDGVVQGLGRADEDTRGGFTHGGWGERYQDEVMGREMARAWTGRGTCCSAAAPGPVPACTVPRARPKPQAETVTDLDILRRLGDHLLS